MTIEEAKEEIPDFDTFVKHACVACRSEWYCPSYCETLIKAEKIFDKVQAAYARHDGDMCKVFRYIKKRRIQQ